MGKIIQLRTNGVKEILEALNELEPEEIAVIAYKDGDWISYVSAIESRSSLIGAVEILKSDLINAF